MSSLLNPAYNERATSNSMSVTKSSSSAGFGSGKRRYATRKVMRLGSQREVVMDISELHLPDQTEDIRNECLEAVATNRTGKKMSKLHVNIANREVRRVIMEGDDRVVRIRLVRRSHELPESVLNRKS